MYDIYEYTDKSMSRRLADMDCGISDRAMNNWPNPKRGEVFFAKNLCDPSLNLWGYDGEWHGKPPRESYPPDVQYLEWTQYLQWTNGRMNEIGMIPVRKWS